MNSNACPYLSGALNAALAPARPWNPLGDSHIIPSDSSYVGIREDRLQRLLAPEQAPTALETEVHASLVDKILGDEFACVAARSAFNREGYRIGVYPTLGSPRAAAAVCHDLYEFSQEFKDPGDTFSTFMAVFPESQTAGEEQFEQLLWKQLQAMHDIDSEHFEWSGAVSSDPDSAEFSFSIGGRAFFVVGMNPHASRKSRLTPWPVIVFNPHEQFERLRARGKYESLQAAIRKRDIALQGDINPVLSNFGERSETRQYSGRQVSEEWRCPFHNKAKQQ